MDQLDRPLSLRWRIWGVHLEMSCIVTASSSVIVPPDDSTSIALLVKITYLCAVLSPYPHVPIRISTDERRFAPVVIISEQFDSSDDP